MTKYLAVFVTFIAASMTAVAAWDRGGTDIDKLLLIALSVIIVVAVHLLLALSRRPATILIWVGCLACAIYGHLTFLTHASLRAGDQRAEQSTVVTATARQIDMVQEALSEIKARPIAVVSAELALSNDRRRRAALRTEIAEGERAESLRDELVRLTGMATTAKVMSITDPVTSRLATVMGYSENTIAVIIGMTFAILLELIGTLLWYEALNNNVMTEVITQESLEPENDLDIVRKAIESGRCRETVASIREFLECSQQRAMELRRELVEDNWIIREVA